MNQLQDMLEHSARAEISQARMQALLDERAIIINHYPIMKGDFVWVNNAWYLVEEFYRGDDLKGHKIANDYSLNQVLAYVDNASETISNAKLANAEWIEKDSFQAEKVYQKMSEVDLQQENSRLRWGYTIPQVKKYVDSMAKRMLEFRGGIKSYYYAEGDYHFILTPEFWQALPDDAVKAHIARDYAQYGIEYREIEGGTKVYIPVTLDVEPRYNDLYRSFLDRFKSMYDY